MTLMRPWKAEIGAGDFAFDVQVFAGSADHFAPKGGGSAAISMMAKLE